MGISLLKDANAKHAVSKEFTATGNIAGSATEPFNVRAENQLQVVVEHVGGGNTVLVKGRIAKQAVYSTLATITGTSNGTTIDISLIDEIYYTCGVYSASGGTPKVVASGFFEKASSGGGGGSVNSASNVGSGGVGLFDAKIGSDLQFKNINAGSSKITITDDTGDKEVDIDVDPSQIDIDDLGLTGTFSNDTWLGVNSSGITESIPGFGFTTPRGMNADLTYQPNDAGGQNFHSFSQALDPLQDSPNDSYSMMFIGLQIDPNNTGFQLGTNGSAANVLNLYVNHQGTSDVGQLTQITQYFDLGNGTDPISVHGLAYQTAFGNIHANVTFSGTLQGFLFQPAIDANAIMDAGNSNISPYGDFLNAPLEMNGYNSFSASPIIGSIRNNTGYVGFNVNANIGTMIGNSGATGFAWSPTIGLTNSGYSSGFNANPTVTLNKGTVVAFTNSFNNVTNYAGVAATLVEQDLTFTCDTVGDEGNGVTIEYTPGGTAGAEVVSVASLAISVQIDDGVSTATQIKAAIDGNIQASLLVNVTISGTGGNAQTVFGPTNLAGGEDAGQTRAGDLNGDLNINGGLSFSGALSIGALQAFYSEPLVDGGGNPGSGHTLITNPTVAANATVANADYLGVNTAALIQIGANATVTTAFLGVAALGLPAVLSMGAGATLDRVAGAVFALSLDAGAGGGTVDTVSLCRAIAIPNGSTTVNRLYGYEVVLPFGTVATDQWGIYSSPVAHNWLNGSLRIGGTAITDDTADPGKVLHADGDTLLDGKMTVTGNIGFFGADNVSQQVGGAATAGALYTATEQTMLQAVYDAMRAYGLLT